MDGRDRLVEPIPANYFDKRVDVGCVFGPVLPQQVAAVIGIGGVPANKVLVQQIGHRWFPFGARLLV